MMETRRGILIAIDPDAWTWRDLMRDLAAGTLVLFAGAAAGAGAIAVVMGLAELVEWLVG